MGYGATDYRRGSSIWHRQSCPVHHHGYRGSLAWRTLGPQLLEARCGRGSPQRLPGSDHAGHRLLRLTPRKSLHAARQRSRHGAGRPAGPDHVRRSGLLRSPRASTGAGDRSSGDDPADGPPDPAGHHDVGLLGGPGVGLSVAGASACAGCAAVVSRRDPLRLSGLRKELPPDPGQAADGLSAAGSRKPRRRKGSQTLRPQQVLHGADFRRSQIRSISRTLLSPDRS